jgi:hypothetical protein
VGIFNDSIGSNHRREESCFCFLTQLQIQVCGEVWYNVLTNNIAKDIILSALLLPVFWRN